MTPQDKVNSVRQLVTKLNDLIDILKADSIDVRVRQDFPLWHVNVTINKVEPL